MPRFQIQQCRPIKTREFGLNFFPHWIGFRLSFGQKLQTALHAKAKESPNFRFHALYDKVYRKDVLAYAYERCKANGGAAGVDNQTFENIEAYGRERWLDELAQELKSRTYQPLPVRRVYIPKPDGKQRPLGIPTVAS